jgi:hypothetical protein
MSTAEAEPWPWWVVEEFHFDEPEIAFAKANLLPIADHEMHESWTQLWGDLKTSIAG